MLADDTKDRPLLGGAGSDAGASILSCVINLSCTCMGTGILALPFAFSMAGFAAGSAILIFSAFVCVISLYMLVSSGRKLDGPVNFATLCVAALGPPAGIGIDLSVIANCLGTATSYLIVAADCFSAAFDVSRSSVVLGALVATSPAAFFRSMDTLKASSTISICCLVAIVLMVVIFGFGPTEDFDPCPKAPQVEHGHCGGSVTPLSTNGLRIFCTLPYFVMAFTCQQNAFNAIGELRNPTKGRQATVVMCTPILPTILYLTIAVCGYLTFGHRVPSNIINGYPTSSPIVSAARCILGVVVLCNYPLQLFPCRGSALSLLDACLKRSTQSSVLPGRDAADATTPMPSNGAGGIFINGAREVRVTCVFHLTTGMIALFVTDLGALVAVVGSTGSTVVALVCPALAYALLSRASASSLLFGEVTKSPLQAAAMLMLVLSAAVLPSSIFCS